MFYTRLQQHRAIMNSPGRQAPVNPLAPNSVIINRAFDAVIMLSGVIADFTARSNTSLTAANALLDLIRTGLGDIALYSRNELITQIMGSALEDIDGTAQAYVAALA